MSTIYKYFFLHIKILHDENFEKKTLLFAGFFNVLYKKIMKKSFIKKNFGRRMKCLKKKFKQTDEWITFFPIGFFSLSSMEKKSIFAIKLNVK